ncbi:AAA family ATPase [Ruegeria lacuscaerulensis]|uniref:AAA family ATPase n=1 Tax=Ruegeria lacuscaerulensis TaxID=55218 RepID=UPI0014807E6E|nr:AAA family ATPase [Ruegeria lacuscaerulensis]
MHIEIAGYRIEQQIESFYSSSLFQARHRDNGRTALIKTLSAKFSDVQNAKRLEREYWLLTELSEIQGVLPVSGIHFHSNGTPAVISPATGWTLAYYLRARRASTWPIDQIVDIIIQLTTALDAVHDRNMVHKNIAPQNILLDDTNWTVKLMNFEIATSLSREHQGNVASNLVEDQLPYISPEQTARISRDVDYRSDFYSLGVVFFELLFGRLPFSAKTHLEWIHAHIAKLPRIPDDASAHVPSSVIAIILRLLAKNPEDRYQSSFGLLNDLQECHRQLVETGHIIPFELAQRDISEVFRVPQVLYGRDTELARLNGLFENVKRGETEFCLISGSSGVGKSALVDELSKPILRARGFFLRGKFDQFERAKPYSGIAAAFSGLVQELLAESPEQLSKWKEDILDALGRTTQALLDILPELEQIIGPQPPVPALPPAEAQNRLQLTFLNFVRLLATADHPLVVYLDDLQWSDAPTLNLLQKLTTARDIGHFLVIGAYRDGEVDGNHLLSLVRNEIAKSREIHDITLPPLPRSVVNQIIARTFRTSETATQDLSTILFRTTQGNPLFVKELLQSLFEDGLIQFDRAHGCWTWELTAIGHANVGDNIVDFLIGNLNKLQDDTKDTLRMAACIGHEFDMAKLSVVHQRSKEQLGLALMSALSRNIILPLDDSYQLFDKAAAHTEAQADASMNPRFRFQHDRVHQAAYELIDDADKQQVHLSIGRLLQKEETDEPSGEHLIKIVRHLNEARDLITLKPDKCELARLNLASARIALDASSYQAALNYLRVSRSLLPANAWKQAYELTKELSSLYAQTAYLNGLHDEADAELSLALKNLHTPLEKAQTLSMRTRHYSTLGRMKDSIDAALQGLQLLGIEISADVSWAEVDTEIAEISKNLAGRNVADLIHAGRMTDENMSAAVGLLMEIFPAAFLSGAGNLFHFLVLKSVNLSLRFGNSTETAFAYATYGMLLCGSMNRPGEGYEYGKLALAMNDAYDDIALKSRIIYVYTMFIHHWSHHWTTMTGWFKRGIEFGYQSGDLLYLAYNAQDCIIWDPRLDLETAIAGQIKYLAVVKDCKYADSYDSGTLFLQMLQNFAGNTRDRYALTNEDFDEEVCLNGMQARKFMTGVANYHIYKTEIHCMYRDFQGALPHVVAQERSMDSVMSLPQSARFRFVAFLTYAGIFRETPKADQPRFWQKMKDHAAQMAIWARHCPENFRHLDLAMTAELARLNSEVLAAFHGYEEAITCAAENGFTRDTAMIHELFAMAFQDIGQTIAAEAHLNAARHLYHRWGATRKVAILDAENASIQQITQAHSPREGTNASGNATHDISQGSLDLGAVMDAARAISGEIVLNKLLSRTMRILLESTGAQRGLFLSGNGNGWQVEVECQVKTDGTKTMASKTGADQDKVPLSVINYVARTRKPLVLDNATMAPRFDVDPYIAGNETKSIMCVPIIRSDQFTGMVYLENNLAAGAFPEARLSIAELLAAQASISIENAKLYVELEQKVEERTAELSRKSNALEAVANQLSKYLSPQVYRSIFDKEKEVRLTSERKLLTVFFSDLVGFTELAEQMRSEDLKTLLNHYLSEMSDVALSFGATIDKFVGDAIVIFFGDPESHGTQNDALACAKMALAMRDRLTTLRKQWMDNGIEKPLECRMGIHTGFCTVGNFGSETRMDYTIIGRAVNLASRLENAARTGGILISQETYEQINSQISCVECDTIELRGIGDPVRTYEIVDLIDTPSGDHTTRR